MCKYFEKSFVDDHYTLWMLLEQFLVYLQSILGKNEFSHLHLKHTKNYKEW